MRLIGVVAVVFVPFAASAAGVIQPKGWEQPPAFMHDKLEGNGVLRTVATAGQIAIPVNMDIDVEYRLSFKVRGEGIGAGSAARGSLSCGVPFEKVGRHTDTFNGSPSNAGRWNDVATKDTVKMAKWHVQCRVVLAWDLGPHGGHFLFDEVQLRRADGTGDNVVVNGTFEEAGSSIEVQAAAAVATTPAPTAAPAAASTPTATPADKPKVPMNIKLPGKR